ncbi:hypothetical protein [Candidatus Magnetominusculus dajiuhuensis]|uniref:hypothetical protein n=1 Tax=Candidatus Magnetominusculus dajiuhuensis TaxID=3137712 RepID=UPI0019FD01D6|nr:hypothetical protein [Nitrospirota bacterium]
MIEVKDMSLEDLERFIEQKVVEVIGDPDTGLQLREDFKAVLQQRLSNTAKRIPHDVVMRRFV